MGTALFAIAMFTVGVIRYRIFRAQVDLGIFTQVIASTFSGFSSTAEGGVNHLAVHFSPILFLCWPLLAVTQSPLALIAIQATASAAAIPAIFLLAKRHMPRKLAMLTALAVITYPPLISMTIGDFHELAFATPIILWLVLALSARRFNTAAVFAIVALGIKEDVTLILVALAIFIAMWAWLRGDIALARFATALSLLSTTVLAGYFAIIRPAVGAAHPLGLPEYYNWNYMGTTPHGFAPLGSPLRIEYLKGILLPMVGLPLLTPAFVLALPGLTEVLASHQAITLDLSTHYVACWLPYVLLAFTLGVSQVSRKSTLLAYILVGCTVATSLWTDIYASPANWWYQIYRFPDARDAMLERTLQNLPREAQIGSDLWMFAHLGLHPHATIDPRKADIVVVDRRCDTAYCRQQIFPFVEDLMALHALRLLSSENGIEIYHRM